MMDSSSWGSVLNSVGWFIPAYLQMRVIHSLVDKISSSQGRFSQDDLEKELAQIYNPINLAAMVYHRFPDVPIIQDFRITIEEAIEAHFMGLHHVAMSGLVPVIEGVGRNFIEARGITEPHKVKDVFTNLTYDIKNEARKRGIGLPDEIDAMTDSFAHFTNNYLYLKSTSYALPDKTNRHGILHGAFQDSDYGKPINFYKIISAIEFLTFFLSVDPSFPAQISCFAPDSTEESLKLALYYGNLNGIRASKGKVYDHSLLSILKESLKIH